MTKLLLSLLAVLSLAACGTPPASRPQLRTIEQPVLATEPAPATTVPEPELVPEQEQVPVPEPVATRGTQIQLTPPPTPPPFDPIVYVNGLAYCWTCMDPAMEAYRVVATYYGWPSELIEARADFVYIIMATESAGCWNARRWTTGTSLGRPCLETNPGVHDDVGFGQITDILEPLVCEKVALCGREARVSSPWNSMLAFVAVMGELGKRPWCYLNNTHIRNGHCAKWPG